MACGNNAKAKTNHLHYAVDTRATCANTPSPTQPQALFQASFNYYMRSQSSSRSMSWRSFAQYSHKHEYNFSVRSKAVGTHALYSSSQMKLWPQVKRCDAMGPEQILPAWENISSWQLGTPSNLQPQNSLPLTLSHPCDKNSAATPNCCYNKRTHTI